MLCCLLGTHYVFLVIKLLDTFDKLYDAFPHAPPGFIKDALPVGKALDNAESSSFTLFMSLVGSNPVDIELENEILNPPLSHPTLSNGSMEHYKARLVAKEFTQEYGIDYEETFAPTARLTLVRNLIAITATKE
ncbi:hypothetical protein SLEP1_g47933 [Rubroshorea leprosula]|uniref:Reverse transcriptase Ty1/copia-type domain-containing protein n=1 Tax=Rubroshorea leprosula TaxID=152421 RepID=A0AAV5LS29_9ROSI|nr:hypothetical protein SLEP1_g47933 [Rubroshorea leprosula]